MGSHNPRRVCALLAGFILTFGINVDVTKAQSTQPPSGNIDVAVGSNTPLTAISVTPGSLNCAQGRVVVDKNGKAGFLAPVIGPNVLRGSADSGSAVSWAVVPLDEVSPEMLNAVTTCLTAR